MAINRSDFLRLSAWGFVATLLPLHEIKALSFISSANNYNKEDHMLALNNAAQAKEHFFKKEYSKAEIVYLDCIKLAPADIRLYDGLQNVYGAQGKWLLCVELFKNAMSANPEKVEFYDRAARSLMRLELGYPDIAAQYRDQTNSDSLLKDAESLYTRAIQINPDALYLKIGEAKVKHKIAIDAVNIDYKTNKVHKANRKNRRALHKARYSPLSNDELLNRITIIENKRRNTLYFDNENNTRRKNIQNELKLIHMELANRYFNEKNYDGAMNYAQKVYAIDINDTKIVKLIKRLFIKSKNYSGLVDFQLQYDSQNRTVYTALGVMHALQLKYENETQSPSLLSQAIAIGEDLLINWGLVDSLMIKTIAKLTTIYILNRQYREAIELVRKIIDTVPIKSEGMINTLIYCYGKAHMENRDFTAAEEIALLGIKDYKAIDSPKHENVKLLADKKEKNIFTMNLPLYYLLYEIYNRMDNDFDKESTLQYILTNDPENRFASNRL
ncbi:MAG: hypothetical protein Aureis2KO_18660 [Aureisphaera sp.]